MAIPANALNAMTSPLVNDRCLIKLNSDLKYWEGVTPDISTFESLFKLFFLKSSLNILPTVSIFQRNW